MRRTTTPTLSRMVDEGARLRGELLTLEVLVALRIYQRRHGELPAALTQLVPDLLSKVPIDPFDGKPIRYSRTKGIMYLVGTDFIYSGGLISTGRRYDETEPTYPIDPPEKP